MSPNGVALSRLVYGTWRLLDDAEGAAPERLVRRLQLCVERGITTVDTAEVYGAYEVEERLGAALRLDKGLRARLEIVTKCGIYVPVPRHPDRKVAQYNASADRIVKSAEKSLRLLGTDYLDVLLIHRPDWLTPAAETAAGFERLLQSGKVRAVGVSNYDVAQFDALQACMSQPLVTNQIELSLFHTAPLTDGTLSHCERRGVKPMAWSPLGGGRLFRAGDETAARVRAACAALAPRYGNAAPEALAIAWILALPSQPVVVLGTNKVDRIEASVAAQSIQLAREDWFQLREAACGRIP
jgi:predicted oxidoreductase